jgi:hypothetical protein
VHDPETVRWSALFFLAYLEWTKQQTLSALPLVFLLLPEGALIPSGPQVTVYVVILYACALAAGSFLLAGIVIGLGALHFRMQSPRNNVRDKIADQ